MESILKVESMGFANGLDVECEKKRCIGDDFEIWRLRNIECKRNHLQK